MSILTFFLLSLGLWRVSKLITDEDGPFDIFANMRARLSQSSWVGRGVRCIWCVSFWLGLLLGFLYGLREGWGWEQMVVFGLAWSTVVILIDEKGVRHE